jgi:7-carboxy-7-deazaguanine synthase
MLRLLEHYVSMQGECDRTGIPTQFVRFAGCNLTCNGWKCDTPFAINPKLYRKEQKFVPVNSIDVGLVGKIVAQAKETGAANVCLTGGEPMLQPKEDLDDLINLLANNGHYTLEMFSNGTLLYSKTIMKSCSIRMDWKLPGSLEDQSGPGWDQRINNYLIMGEWPHHTIKFTIKDQNDFETAMVIYDKFGMDTWPGTIYAGPVWDAKFTAANIADGILANRLPWRLNLQMHNYVWPPNERRR